MNYAVLDGVRAEYPAEYVTHDFARVCEDPDIDAVLIGTKPSFRLPIMSAAVAHGKHIFVEKPMSMDLMETIDMYRLICGSRSRFMVGHNRPYSPIMRDAKDLFQRARLGCDARANRSLIIYRIVGEAQLWPEHHRSSVLRGESTIIHELTHIFDLLNWLLDAEPTSVFAAGGGNMDNTITLEYPDGTTAVIISGDNGSAGYPKEWLEINTNHTVISARSFVELVFSGERLGHGRRLYPYTVDGKSVSTSFHDYENLIWEARVSITDREREHGYYYHKMPLENKGHAEELDAFYDLVVKGIPIAADVRRSALATLIALQAIDSLHARQPLRLTFPELSRISDVEIIQV